MLVLLSVVDETAGGALRDHTMVNPLWNTIWVRSYAIIAETRCAKCVSDELGTLN